jgi:hypothetical protein
VTGLTENLKIAVRAGLSSAHHWPRGASRPLASAGPGYGCGSYCSQPEGTVTATEAGDYPDHQKRRASWLEANACGAITCEDRHFIARLGAREIWRHQDLGKLMDRLDYLGGPYGKTVGTA